MRIGLNLLFLLPGETGGIQTHACALIEELARIDTRNDYFLFLNQESGGLFAGLPKNFRRVPCPFRAQRRAVRYAWEQLVLPAQAIALRLDLLHSLAYVGPVFAPCVSVVTTHDVNFLAWGGAMGLGRRAVMGGICLALAHRAELVLTVSNFAASEIVRRMGVAKLKVIVVPNAGARGSLAIPEGACRRLDKPYVVAFGGGDQNKNIRRLVEAYARLAGEFPHSLVLIGRVPDYVKQVIESLPPAVRTRVVAPGYLSAEDVQRTLAEADVFVFPSFYEGFGIPILEAQAAGVPVACSDAASLPEVAGGSTELFDPHQSTDMAAAIARVLSNPALRQRLRAAGHNNVLRYSWTTSAARLLATYESIGARHGNSKTCAT